MLPKDRFLAAMLRKPVDRVPLFDFLFQKPLYTELIGRTPEAYNARDAMDLTVALGLDGVWMPYGCYSGWSPETLSENVYKDQWGTTFEKSEFAWPIDAPIAYPLKSRADLDGYAPPDPSTEGRLDEIHTAVALNKALGNRAVAVLGGVTGPFTTCWLLMGYDTICLNLYDDPRFVERVAQMAVDFALGAVPRMARAGVDAVILADDYGCSVGGFLRPTQFKAIFKPALKQISDCIKAHDLPLFFHSCGCIKDYLDDLVELGMDALHPLQRTAGMDLAEVKRKYGDRVCLVGNIDSSRTLPYGSREDVEREVLEALRIAAPGYGYILASDHSLHDGISVENIRCMLDTARKHGAYPMAGADQH